MLCGVLYLEWSFKYIWCKVLEIQFFWLTKLSPWRDKWILTKQEHRSVPCVHCTRAWRALLSIHMLVSTLDNCFWLELSLLVHQVDLSCTQTLFNLTYTGHEFYYNLENQIFVVQPLIKTVSKRFIWWILDQSKKSK